MGGPFKWLVGAIALVGALAGLLWLGNHVLDNARQDGRLAERTVWQAKERAASDAKAQVEHDLAAQMGQRFNSLTETLIGLGRADQDINVKLPPMIAAAPRYRDPDCALTPEVLQELNAKRALSQ